jgi:hypothetical protein
MGLPTIAVPQYTLTVPSSGEALKFRPFLVKEEKILLIAMESENQTQIIDATKEIIQNCVYGDINVESMPIFDLEFIFLQLRGKAKGEEIDLKYKCPKCEEEIPILINIDDVQVQKQPEHTNNIKLTDDLGVMMKYPSIILQNQIENLSDKQNKIEALFLTIIKCIDCIYDNENTYPAKDHTEKEMTDFIESLTDAQFQKIAKFFDTMPKLKHEIELHCTNKIKGKVKGKVKETKVCGYKEPVVLEGLASFFG